MLNPETTSTNTGLSMKRGLGMKEAVTITVGSVVGVGLFTVGASGVGYLGPMVLLATFAAFIVSLLPATLYAEMGAALPFAGGTYNYAKFGLGRMWAMQAGWNYVMSLIAVIAGESLAISYYFRMMFDAYGIELTFDDRIIAVAVTLVFMYINWRGVEIAGRIQNGFVFFFWGVAVIWFITLFPKLQHGYYTPFIAPPDTDISTFILATALIWWCFAGFEACCAMGEEIKFPQISIPRALFLTPFIVFTINALFQWFLVGIVPASEYELIKTAYAPFAQGMKTAGMVGFPIAMLCIGVSFGGGSTMGPAITTPARYLYSMSRDGVLPKIFSRLHPQYNTPYVALLTISAIAIILVATNSIIYIASVSLFADLFYYIIGFSAAIGLRKKVPDLTRPYKAPLAMLAAGVSIIAYLVMMSQLPADAFWTGAIWCIIGIILFVIYRKKYEKEELLIPEIPPEPTVEERKVLDEEFTLWRNIVGLAFIGSLILFISPYILKW